MPQAYIAQVATPHPQQTQMQPSNAPFDPWILFWAGLGSAGTGLGAFLLKVSNSTIVSKTIDGRLNLKQAETNAAVAEKLTNINIEKQEAESFIDLSNTVSDIAKQGVNNSSEIAKDLLQLVSGAIQSTQSLAKAGESQNKATQDLINATSHNTEALGALREAVETIPKEIASANEIFFAKIRAALDNIGERLEESVKIKREGYAEIQKAINLSESRIIDQYSGTIAQLRRDFKTLETFIKDLKAE